MSVIKIKSSRNKIKIPKTRLKFERFIRKLGYRDRSPIYPEQSKKRRQINYQCEDGSAMAVYLFIIPYQTKKSYLYLEFLDLKDDPEVEKKIKSFAELIRFKEKTMLADVGWEAKYTKQPHYYSMNDRKKIIYNLFQQLIESLSKGMCGYNPQPGIILAAKPYGPKINEGFNESSITIGTHQRYLVAKKVGFGQLKDNGFCYARYDENCILRPI